MYQDGLRSALSSPINPATPAGGRPASVLVAIHGANPHVIMTVKPKNMKFHAGEVSFPGGKMEPSDSDLLDTALRETAEEVGLRVSRDQVIGQLRPVATLNSGFAILPFVALLDSAPGLSANPEVEQILCMPLAELLGTMQADTDPSHRTGGDAWVFSHGNNTVWGASARILWQIRGLVS